MPNISAQIFYFNIALFLFNFVLIQVISKKLIENYQLKKQLNSNPEEKIIKATREAQEIITKAGQSANEIIANISNKVGQIDTDVNLNLAELSEGHTLILEKSTERFKNESDKLFQGLSDKLVDHIESIAIELNDNKHKAIKLLLDNSEKQISDTNQEIVNMIKEDLKTVKESIKKYKKQKEQEIDLLVNEKINLTVKKVLPRIVSKDIHQEIILEAINKAKSENIFL